MPPNSTILYFRDGCLGCLYYGLCSVWHLPVWCHRHPYEDALGALGVQHLVTTGSQEMSSSFKALPDDAVVHVHIWQCHPHFHATFWFSNSLEVPVTPAQLLSFIPGPPGPGYALSSSRLIDHLHSCSPAFVWTVILTYLQPAVSD